MRIVPILMILLTSAQLLADSQMNVVFFLVDDLGYHDLSMTGSSVYETPQIDRLAGDALTLRASRHRRRAPATGDEPCARTIRCCANEVQQARGCRAWPDQLGPAFEARNGRCRSSRCCGPRSPASFGGRRCDRTSRSSRPLRRVRTAG